MAALPAPEVTIVIPVWDRYCDFLVECVESAVAQQGISVRALVVDNASDRPLPPLPPSVGIVHAPDRLTVGAARNLGLGRVETPYVTFLDADDILLPGALAWLTGEIARDEHSVTACGRYVTWSAGTGEARIVRRAPKPIAIRVSRHRRLFALANLAYNSFSVVGCVHRTDAVRAAGGFADAGVGEDWVLGAMLCTRGRVRLSEQPVFLRRVHEGSLWHREHDPGVLVSARAALHERARRDPAVPMWTKLLLPLLALLHRRSLRRAAARGVVAPESPALPREASA